MRSFLTGIFLLTFFLGNAQLGGKSTFQFLNTVSSAKIAALGGYAVANPSADLEMTYFNPALLTDTLVNEINLNYVDYFSDINYGFIGYAKDFKKYGVFSGGVKYINYGKFIQANEYGDIQGEFTVNEGVAFVGYSKQYKEHFRYGGNLKLAFSQLQQYNSFGALLDLGATYYRPTKGFMAAIIVKNIGSQFKPYVSGNFEPMPFEIQLGLSQKLKHAPFRFNVTFHNLQQPNIWYASPNNQQTATILGEEQQEQKINYLDAAFRHVAIGAEIFPDKALQLRVGYNHQRRQELTLSDGNKQGLVGFSFGVGLKIKGFQLNYGRATYSIAGSTNHISISTNLSNFKRVVKKKEKQNDVKEDKGE